MIRKQECGPPPRDTPASDPLSMPAHGVRWWRDELVRPPRKWSSLVIELRSDNAAGVAPEIIAALHSANVGPAPAYGRDQLTAHLKDVVRVVFEHSSARVFPVTSGTAANAL